MSSKSFTIDIFDDDIIEGDEVFTVEIVSVSQCGISIGNFDTILVTIIDDEGVYIHMYVCTQNNMYVCTQFFVLLIPLQMIQNIVYLNIDA